MTYSDSVLDRPPSRLFKYRSVDLGFESGAAYTRDREIIERNLLWASSPTSFNDPFDCVPVIDLSGTISEQTAFNMRVSARRRKEGKPAWSKQTRPRNEILVSESFHLTEEKAVEFWINLLPRLGVVCLAEDSCNMLMWSYYAASHQGYCLEFDTASLPMMRSYRVVYDPMRPVFRVLDPDRTNLMDQVLLRKADYWANEQEWRIVNPISGHLEFPAESLKGIILGANISRECEDTLRMIVKKREPTIRIKRAKLDNRSFRLSIVDA